MAENFPNLKGADIKIQEAQRAPNKLNPNRSTPRHIIIKMAKFICCCVALGSISGHL